MTSMYIVVDLCRFSQIVTMYHFSTMQSVIILIVFTSFSIQNLQLPVLMICLYAEVVILMHV